MSENRISYDVTQTVVKIKRYEQKFPFLHVTLEQLIIMFIYLRYVSYVLQTVLYIGCTANDICEMALLNTKCKYAEHVQVW